MNSKPLYDSAGGRLGRLSNLISPHSPYDAARSPTLDELVAFVGLASWRGVGQKRLYEIAETGKPYVQSFDELLLNAPTEISANPRNHLDHARRLLDELHQRGVLILLRSDPRFPASLMDLARPPHWLFVQGDVELLKEPSIGIVGTRKPTSDGLFLARYVGSCLRDWGRTTVSGLAMGIDTIAHEQSIRACVPTIAVLGTNILEEYPRGSSSLREKIIASGGAIVSEYIPSVSYSAENFVQRNRLQAALGQLLQDALIGARHTAGRVHIFDAHQPVACVGAGVQPAGQRRHQRACMQKAGRRGREPACVPHTHAGSAFLQD